jgi:hypothetical protein
MHGNANESNGASILTDRFVTLALSVIVLLQCHVRFLGRYVGKEGVCCGKPYSHQENCDFVVLVAWQRRSARTRNVRRGIRASRRTR